MRDIASGAMSRAQYDALIDLIDAHRAFDEDIPERFSTELTRLRQLRAEAWPHCPRA